MVCSLFGEHRCCISFCLIYPPPCLHPRHRHHYYYFLRFHRPPPPTPISFAGADVLPLSSREKFFYNFRIVLSRPSLFFHLCAGRFPRVGLFFHHQACFSSSSPTLVLSVSPPPSRFVFSLSHFHLVPRSTLSSLHSRASFHLSRLFRRSGKHFPFPFSANSARSAVLIK